MIEIKIDDKILELNENTGFSLTRKSHLFLSGELDKITTTYSSNIKIPLTAYNKFILNFPDVIDNYDQMILEKNCELLYNGFYMFSGKLSITNVDTESITIKIIYNPYKKMKESKLTELNLDSYSFADVSSILSHAKDTAEDPENYDYAFFPVYNPGWWTENPDRAGAYQNKYDCDLNRFVSSPQIQAAMPFLRIDYLLKKIAENSDYFIENLWQTEQELKRLYLYNNKSLYEKNQWGLTIDLNSHVPNVSSADFVKWLMKTFALSIFPIEDKATLRIRSLKDILNDGDYQDWTYAASSFYQIVQNNKYPSQLGYKETSEEYIDYANLIEVETTADIHCSDSPGFYYVKATNHIWKKTTATSEPCKILQPEIFLRQTINKDIDNFFLSEFCPLKNKRQYEQYQDPDDYDVPAPQISIAGDIKGVQEGRNTGLKMLLYRGMFDWIGNSTVKFPFANSGAYGPYESALSTEKYSLYWNGDKGLYEKWWKEWIFFMQNRKIVKRKFVLNFIDIINFSFEKKIKVGNIMYFCNEIKIMMSHGNKIEVEAHLSSIIQT